MCEVELLRRKGMGAGVDTRVGLVSVYFSGWVVGMG